MTFKFVFIIMYRIEVYLGCYNFIVIIIYIALKEHNIRIKMSSFQLNKLVRVESFINLSPVPFLPRVVIIFNRLYQIATIFYITFVCIVYLGLHTASYLLF